MQAKSAGPQAKSARYSGCAWARIEAESGDSGCRWALQAKLVHDQATEERTLAAKGRIQTALGRGLMSTVRLALAN